MVDKHIQLGKKEIERIIEGYTRESGVRNLEKQIAKIVRYIARAIAMKEEYNPKISLEDIRKILGIPSEHDKYEDNEVAGVVTGLAWTSVGGDILYRISFLQRQWRSFYHGKYRNCDEGISNNSLGIYQITCPTVWLGYAYFRTIQDTYAYPRRSNT